MLLVLPSCGIPNRRHADRRPDLPESFHEATDSENSAQVRIEEFFDDLMLRRLIDQALVGNREVKIPAQDVRIAGNVILARRGAYLPFVTFGGGAGADNPNLDTPEGAAEELTRSSLTERSRDLEYF